MPTPEGGPTFQWEFVDLEIFRKVRDEANCRDNVFVTGADGLVVAVGIRLKDPQDSILFLRPFTTIEHPPFPEPPLIAGRQIEVPNATLIDVPAR